MNEGVLELPRWIASAIAHSLRVGRPSRFVASLWIPIGREGQLRPNSLIIHDLDGLPTEVAPRAMSTAEAQKSAALVRDVMTLSGNQLWGFVVNSHESRAPAFALGDLLGSADHHLLRVELGDTTVRFFVVASNDVPVDSSVAVVDVAYSPDDFRPLGTVDPDLLRSLVAEALRLSALQANSWRELLHYRSDAELRLMTGAEFDPSARAAAEHALTVQRLKADAEFSGMAENARAREAERRLDLERAQLLSDDARAVIGELPPVSPAPTALTASDAIADVRRTRDRLIMALQPPTPARSERVGCLGAMVIFVAMSVIAVVMKPRVQTS